MGRTTTVVLDADTDELIQHHKIQLSDYVRTRIKSEYGGVENIQKKIEEYKEKIVKLERWIKLIEFRKNKKTEEAVEKEEGIVQEKEEMFWEETLKQMETLGGIRFLQDRMQVYENHFSKKLSQDEFWKLYNLKKGGSVEE